LTYNQHHDQQHPHTPQAGITGNTRAIDSTADDQQVEFIFANLLLIGSGQVIRPVAGKRVF
jgi:hypothetical protein